MSAELKTAAFGNKLTPAQLLAGSMSDVEGASLAVLVYVDKDGYVCTGWSDGHLTDRCGILEVAKHRMIVNASE